MDASLPVEIATTYPSAVYRGQVYTQDALLRLEAGDELRVYDPGRIVTPEMTCTRRPVELTALFADVNRTAREERSITLGPEQQPVFRGRVTATDPDDNPQTAILDVGVGEIRFEVTGTAGDHEPDGPEPGDFVSVAARAIHLTDVDGSRTPEESRAYHLDRLANGDAEERRQSARYLGTLGSERPLDGLFAALRSDEEPTVRAEAATALGRIGMAAHSPETDPDPGIEHRLRDALTADNGDVAEAARLALDDIERIEDDHLHHRDW